jgi:hypothetical protein
MAGLKRVIEMAGGMQKSWGYCLNKVRRQVLKDQVRRFIHLTFGTRGDIKGAVIIGAAPYLEFKRFSELVSDKLPLETREALVAGVSGLLEPCRILPIITQSMCSLVKFKEIVAKAKKDTKRTIKFDPDAFTEEWYFVEHQLIAYPGALREDSTAPPQSNFRVVDESKKSASLQLFDFSVPLDAPRYKAPGTLRPPQMTPNLMDPAVRLAGVLYIEELIPDEPRTLNQFDVLLGLLSFQVRLILDTLREREVRIRLGLALDEESQDDGLPSLAALRPVMIWVCLMGHSMAMLALKHKSPWGTEGYDLTAYRELLIAIIGTTPEAVDRLTDADLGMCKLFCLEDLRLRNWDTKPSLKNIIKEQVQLTPPITP